MSLNKPFGTVVDPKYYIGGINRLAVIDKSQVSASVAAGVATITLPTGATFQEVFFVEATASYTQEYTKGSNGRYVTQTLNFKVESEDIPTMDTLMLTKGVVALVQNKSNQWRILGLSNGLIAEAGTDNASEEDGGGFVVTMNTKNLGYAPFVTADPSSLINSTTV